MATESAAKSERGRAPVEVVLARVRVAGDVHIDPKDDGEIVVRPGQPLQARIQYRVDGPSSRSELCDIRFKSSLGDWSLPSAQVRWEDRPVLQEGEWGSVQQVYSPVEEGRYVLRYHVSIDYKVSEQGGGDGAPLEEHHELSGVIMVNVQSDDRGHADA